MKINLQGGSRTNGIDGKRFTWITKFDKEDIQWIKREMNKHDHGPERN